MPRIGRYCKAYPIARFQEFEGWSENFASSEASATDAKAPDSLPECTTINYLFLQENLTVTAGVYLDKNIVFDKISPEWSQFCRDRLGFEVPPYLHPEPGNLE